MEQFFLNFTNLIKQQEIILIVTHQNPDFDGMSSALALQQFINTLKIENYIVVNNNDLESSLKKAFKMLSEKGTNYNTISKTRALEVSKNSLVIVLDTHKQNMIEEPKLIDKAKTIVVFDHHIKSNDYIKNTTLNYINSNLSSTVEMMVNYFRFLNYRVDELIATFMLVGLEIDTNTFKLKTTEKTYETAAYLSRLGADNIIKQELSKESKDNYLRRNKLIETSFMINKNMAMCMTDANIYKKKDLATVAEELLQFDNVSASFAIGNLDGKVVGVSARSMGKIDVEKIMAKLGGGGHANEAATQFENISLEEAKQRVLMAIGGENEDHSA